MSVPIPKTPKVIFDETADRVKRRGHKHWTETRLPGRSVQRRQKRANGEFRPVRRSRGKAGRRSTSAPTFSPNPSMNFLTPQQLSMFSTLGRRGGNR